jgi:peptidoglycan/LPS O-acetylase OafA/YrhL
VAWTLSFELLFYLVFSFCIVRGIKTAYGIFFFWIGLILLNNYVFHFPGVIDFIANLYILQFLIGCFIAYLVVTKFSISVNVLVGLIFLSLIVLIYENYRAGLSDKYFLSFLLLAINASFIILFCTKYDNYTKHNFFTKTGILIGDASYSIYLSHIFFMSFLGRLFSKAVIGLNLVQWKLNIVLLAIFLIVIFCGVILHLLIEKPMLNFLHFYFIKKKNQAKVEFR